MIPAEFESGFGDGGGDINDNEDGVGDNGNEDGNICFAEVLWNDDVTVSETLLVTIPSRKVRWLKYLHE